MSDRLTQGLILYCDWIRFNLDQALNLSLAKCVNKFCVLFNVTYTVLILFPVEGTCKSIVANLDSI